MAVGEPEGYFEKPPGHRGARFPNNFLPNEPTRGRTARQRNGPHEPGFEFGFDDGKGKQGNASGLAYHFLHRGEHVTTHDVARQGHIGRYKDSFQMSPRCPLDKRQHPWECRSLFDSEPLSRQVGRRAGHEDEGLTGNFEFLYVGRSAKRRAGAKDKLDDSAPQKSWKVLVLGLHNG